MNKKYYKDAPAYGAYFFDLVQSDDLFAEFDKSKALTLGVIDLITPELENYSYQEGKWTVKQIIRHIIDMERVYMDRAFRFSRLDDTPLPGVEEKDYARNADVSNVSLSDLREEYLAVRQSNVWVFKNISDEMLDFRGKANDQTYTPRTLAFATIGHNIHHINFIKTKYLRLPE